MSVCVRYVCAFVVLKTCEGYVCDGCDGSCRWVRRLYSSSRESTNDGTRRETDARDSWGRARGRARGDRGRRARRRSRGGREGCFVVLRSRRGGGVRASIRVDSRRFDSIRFDSIRFDSIRFDSFIHSTTVDWIGFDDAGRRVDDVLVDVRVRVRDGERWDGGGARDAETRAARVSRAPRAREDRRRRRR